MPPSHRAERCRTLPNAPSLPSISTPPPPTFSPRTTTSSPLSSRARCLWAVPDLASRRERYEPPTAQVCSRVTTSSLARLLAAGCGGRLVSMLPASDDGVPNIASVYPRSSSSSSWTLTEST
ncbi:hypothetical protein K466DRAFT_668482 [Polyporus arcularius HHB13444]|uniref:Uncharacterized protein n=1 Tax=Polyporus arcularius HHB13444 TaxID=1314778 RepID=A0A5C3NPN0_9APHY|nr:hypothetical protein K466DRAFT_668482 [Polyporus arcularius HHB13444]